MNNVTPEQLCAGLNKLWYALGLTGPQDKDVLTLAAQRIRSLEAGVWVIVDELGQLGCQEAYHDKVAAEQRADELKWQVQRLVGYPRRAKFLKPAGHKCGVSTGIHDGLTFGSGKLDNNGFWSKPCCECARAYEEQFPDDDECWPYADEQSAAEIMQQAGMSNMLESRRLNLSVE